MKTFQSIFGVLALTAVLTFTFTSCVSRSAQTAAQTSSEVLEVDGLLAGADASVGKTLRVEGVCTHICAHGGGKIFLMGTDDTKTIRIEAGDKIGSFKPETVNSLVRVTGTLVEERIDEAFLAQWEAEIAAQTAPAHGEDEQAGCSADMQARGEEQAETPAGRIANLRQRIAERTASENKDYLSFYHVEADSYEIL